MTDVMSQPATSPTVETSSAPVQTPATETSLVNQTPAPAAVEFTPIAATDITVPEGLTLDTESMDGFLGIMNNRELTPAQQAQALIELQAGLTTKSSEAGSQAWKDQLAGWEQEVVNHPELGGDNLPKTLSNVGRVMDKFADEDVRAAFDQTGAGWNPHIVRFLNAVGLQFAEAGPLPNGAPTNTSEKSVADRLNLTGAPQ